MTHDAAEWAPTARDETLIAYLARGAAHVQAAEAAGVSRSTVRRRLAVPGFRAAVEAERAEIRRRTADQLAALTGQALAALADLLGSENDPTKLGAVRLVLDMALRYTDAVELRRELADLAARLDALETVDPAAPRLVKGASA